jgi:hypothetical protein
MERAPDDEERRSLLAAMIAYRSAVSGTAERILTVSCSILGEDILHRL